jgi:dGTPase
MVQIIGDLREFMFKNVYELPAIRKEFAKAEQIISVLFKHFQENYDIILNSNFIPVSDDKETTIADFIASLTDSYAIHLYNNFFIPKTLKFPEI